ncbi:MAG: D-glycerate dehydrogenase [Candidatus Eremiobacteraeota bacterium]|nr:D-glycerate dehydrogenase [Candidatus Eremiobacteraeota bacterium]
MGRPKVAIFASISPAARERLEQVADIVPAGRVDESEGIYLDSETAVDAAFLERAPRLRAIASKSVGYDLVDVEELTRRGIPFSNARGSLTETVADLILALILMVMRNLSHDIDWVRSGQWMKDQPPLAVDPAGKLLGIVGMGAIGSALAKRARACGMEIAYHNRARRANDAEAGATYLAFDDLLRRADCIALTLPLTAETKGKFGVREFALMKPTAFFVNGARGKIVDTGALYDALANKRLAGAALDVTEPEPLPPDHPLLSLPNVIVTPHIASATNETRNRMALLAVENLIAALDGKPMPTAVNFKAYQTA